MKIEVVIEGRTEMEGWKRMSLPEEKELITVNRSHFIHKKARDQYYIKRRGERYNKEVRDLRATWKEIESLQSKLGWSIEGRRRGMKGGPFSLVVRTPLFRGGGTSSILVRDEV
jgi:ribosomal protein S10